MLERVQTRGMPNACLPREQTGPMTQRCRKRAYLTWSVLRMARSRCGLLRGYALPEDARTRCRELGRGELANLRRPKVLAWVTLAAPTAGGLARSIAPGEALYVFMVPKVAVELLWRHPAHHPRTLGQVETLMWAMIQGSCSKPLVGHYFALRSASWSAVVVTHSYGVL